jgi:hypothetical protein
MRNVLATTAIAMAFLVGWTGITEACCVAQVSTDSIVQQSELVIEGEVTEATSAWDATRTSMYTLYTIKVTRTIKGTCGETIQIRENGGTVDGEGMGVSTATHLKVGQKGIAMLKQLSPDAYAFSAAMQSWKTIQVKDGKEFLYNQKGVEISVEEFIDSEVKPGMKNCKAIELNDVSLDAALNLLGETLGIAFEGIDSLPKTDGTVTLTGTFDGPTVLRAISRQLPVNFTPSGNELFVVSPGYTVDLTDAGIEEVKAFLKDTCGFTLHLAQNAAADNITLNGTYSLYQLADEIGKQWNARLWLYNANSGYAYFN